MLTATTTTKRLLLHNNFKGGNQNKMMESTRDFVEKIIQSLNLSSPIEQSKQIDLIAETCLQSLSRTGDGHADRRSARHLSALPENLLKIDSKLVFSHRFWNEYQKLVLER